MKGASHLQSKSFRYVLHVRNSFPHLQLASSVFSSSIHFRISNGFGTKEQGSQLPKPAQITTSRLVLASGASRFLSQTKNGLPLNFRCHAPHSGLALRFFAGSRSVFATKTWAVQQPQGLDLKKKEKKEFFNSLRCFLKKKNIHISPNPFSAHILPSLLLCPVSAGLGP